jgi:hypothetical protein
MVFDPRRVNLQTLNTLTKYPSIPTYHTLNPTNGRLSEPVVTFPDGATVIGTEKIDGTNARIVFTPDARYFLGSREELLFYRGDVVGNPAMGIVEALKPLAERLSDSPVVSGRLGGERLVVLFLEVFGGKVTANSKQFTGKRAVGFRLFDVATIDGIDTLLALEPSEASTWRDAGGQRFAAYGELERLSGDLDVALVPEVFRVGVAGLPRTIEETQEFLTGQISRTFAALDDAAGGQAEGSSCATWTARRSRS